MLMNKTTSVLTVHSILLTHSDSSAPEHLQVQDILSKIG